MDEVHAKRRRLNDDNGEDPDSEPLEIRTPDNSAERFPNMVTVNGDKFPRFPVQDSPEEHLWNIRTMPMREDDVIIVSFPLSGARWIWEISQMLVTGCTEHDSRTKEHLTIELNPAADMASAPSPRVLCSHLFLRQLSNDIVQKRSRVIHVMRNPKDLAVSSYYREKQLSLFRDAGFQEFAEDFLNGSGCQSTCLDYCSYLREMKTFQRENPQVPILNIYYEDVHKNPVQSVQALAGFLGLTEVSDGLCGDIAHHCSFRALREAYSDQHVHLAKRHDHPSRILYKDYRPQFFRKGEIGDWKNHFTMALSEHYDAMLTDRLRNYGIAFQYTAD